MMFLTVPHYALWGLSNNQFDKNMTKRIKLDVDRVVSMYQNDMLSSRDIGRIFGVSRTPILSILHGAKINLRKSCVAPVIGHDLADRTYRDKEWLYNQYVVLGKSMLKIANECQLRTSSAIPAWLNKYKIKIRQYEDNVAHFNLTKDISSFLDGLILGDGHIRPGSSVASSYTHADKHLQYMEWLKGKLFEIGIGSGTIYFAKKKLDDGRIAKYYEIASRNYAEFKNIRARWYPSNKKEAPNDLKLNPTSCFNWYVGDGTLCGLPRDRKAIVLCTCGFSENSIGILLSALSDIGFNFTHRPSNNTIHLSVKNSEEFLEYIGVCPNKMSCYKYKWEVGGSDCLHESKY